MPAIRQQEDARVLDPPCRQDEVFGAHREPNARQACDLDPRDASSGSVCLELGDIGVEVQSYVRRLLQPVAVGLTEAHALSLMAHLLGGARDYTIGCQGQHGPLGVGPGLRRPRVL
jgi:hypothetical protein